MRHLLFATILTLLPSLLVAEVKLPSILGSNMVLQRNTEVTLWGTADAGKTVSITTSWNGKKYKVKTDTDERNLLTFFGSSDREKLKEDKKFMAIG